MITAPTIDPAYLRAQSNAVHQLRYKTNHNAWVGFVYLITDDQTGYKIGRSSDVVRRIRRLATATPFDLRIIHVIATDQMEVLENALHVHFASQLIQREWFTLTEQDIWSICRLHGPLLRREMADTSLLYHGPLLPISGAISERRR